MNNYDKIVYMMKLIMAHSYSAIYILLNKNNALTIKNYDITF